MTKIDYALNEKTTFKNPLWCSVGRQIMFAVLFCFFSLYMYSWELQLIKGVFHLSELAHQTGQFVNGMHKFEG